MKGRILTKETITGFINHLHLEEKSEKLSALFKQNMLIKYDFKCIIVKCVTT